MNSLMEISELQQSYTVKSESQLHINTPEEVKRAQPLAADAESFIARSRQTIRNILGGSDHRLFVVVGPCSIHDPKAAIEYAYRLKELAYQLGDTLYLVMRVYFEKPRTTIGWKGLINDPSLDGSFKVNEGLSIARQLLIDITDLNLPVATEALDPISAQYTQDLVTWSAIGARTTESQTHRELASGLSSPVGFKNGTDGNFGVAINAIKSSEQTHCFLGINNEGRVSVVHTDGNKDTHIVLRGGGGKPNYDPENVALCEKMFLEQGIKPKIMIDCSHVNSQNNHLNQPLLINDVTQQILASNKSIKGLMIESNLHSGSQPLTKNLSALRYGVSITDQCIGWKETENYLRKMHKALKHVLQKRQISC
jgi:3-deoxy-7-phosphoheptulonate synthase